jgi:uncharacterized protein YjbJ (UPF0337 family)
MNKDQVKGAVNDAAGRAKRQVGEWTGNTNAQAEGGAQQLKGKVQKAWGDLKQAANQAKEDTRRERKNNVDEDPVVVVDENDRRKDSVMTRDRK